MPNIIKFLSCLYTFSNRVFNMCCWLCRQHFKTSQWCWESEVTTVLKDEVKSFVESHTSRRFQNQPQTPMDISGSLRMKIRDRRTKIQLSLESCTLISTKFPSLSGPQLAHLYHEHTEAPCMLYSSKTNSKSNNKKEREKGIQEYTSCRSSKTTKDDWKKGFGGEKGGDQKIYPQVSFGRSSMAWVEPHQD